MVAGNYPPHMHERVAHPRALAAFRVVLYVSAAVVAAGVAAVTLGYLGLVVAIGGIVHLVAGGVNAAAVAGFAGIGLLLAGVAIGATVAVARRIDRRVTRADRVPDPLDAVKRQYVAGDITDATLERRLDRLFGVGSEARRAPNRGSHAGCRHAADARTTGRRTRSDRRIEGDHVPRGRRRP